jgi:hypothetical protein
MPSSSQSFETTSALPWSQSSPTAFPSSSLRIMTSLPPVPVSILSAPINQPDEPPSPHSTVIHPTEESTAIVSSTLLQTVSEPPSSMNPLPNPRFASQMRPIFTDQSIREQEMRENARVIEEQRLAAIKMVKHTITVCAWLVVGLPN